MRKIVVHVAAAVALATVAAPADAAAGHACLSAMSWTFSPPLTTHFATGTVRMEHTSICARTDGGAPIISGAGGADAGTFTGSCALALVSSVNYDAVVLASMGVVQLYPGPPGRNGTTVTVGTADDTCNVTRLSGLAIGAITYS